MYDIVRVFLVDLRYCRARIRKKATQTAGGILNLSTPLKMSGAAPHVRLALQT